LVDDFGLEIDILNKDPGIYSARWGGKNGDFKKAIKRVYKELSKKDKNWQKKKIKARFVCALSICFLDKKIISVLGKVEGFISNEPRGKNGFGYDPIFWVESDQCSSAELTKSRKSELSHRGKALKILIEKLQTKLN
jgi:XTP/dITP diphosphohydrolase